MKLRPLNSAFNFQARGPQVYFDGEVQVGDPPPAAPAGDPAPPPPAGDPSPSADSGVPADLKDILSWDPFAQPPAEPTAPPAAPPKAEGSDPPPAEPAPTPPPVADPVVAELQAIRQSLAQSAPADPPAPKETPPEPPPFADVRVPPELVAALRSDDPNEAAVAVNLLVQGAATMAYRKFQEDFTKFQNEGLPSFIASTRQVEEQARTIKTDFYGKYPELDKPELYPLVQTVAAEMIKAQGQNFKGWDEAFRDAVGTRVVTLLAGVVKAPAPPAPAPAPFTPPSGGPRPAAAPENDILATLFG